MRVAGAERERKKGRGRESFQSTQQTSTCMDGMQDASYHTGNSTSVGVRDMKLRYLPEVGNQRGGSWWLTICGRG